MFGLILMSALAFGDLPEAARTEMNFARLVATRVAMHLAHGTNLNPKRLLIMQSAGRVEMRLDDELLLIGQMRSRLHKRLQPILKALIQRPQTVTVHPPHQEDLPAWIARTSERWAAASELMAMNTGVAPADMVEQRIFSNWHQMSSADRKRLMPIKYMNVLFRDGPELAPAQLEHVERELTVLGLPVQPTSSDLIDLDKFLNRTSCGEQMS